MKQLIGACLWCLMLLPLQATGAVEAYAFEAFSAPSGEAEAEISLNGLTIRPGIRTRSFTLICELRVPEQIEKRTTLLAWRTGQTRAIRIYKGDRPDVFRAAWCCLEEGVDPAEKIIGGDLVIKPGTHTLTLIYHPFQGQELEGTSVWVDKQGPWRVPGLRFSANVANHTPDPDVLKVVIGNDATDTPSTLMKGLEIDGIDFRCGKVEPPKP